MENDDFDRIHQEGGKAFLRAEEGHRMEDAERPDQRPADIEQWQMTALARSLGKFDGGVPQASLFMADGKEPGPEQLRFLKSVDLRTAKLCKLLWDSEAGKPGDADMQVFVGISRNGLEGWAFATPPLGQGQVLSRGQIEAQISSGGVSFGLGTEAFFEATLAGKYMKLFVIANGLLPQEGTDGTVTDRFLRDRQIRLAASNNGAIDYKDLNWLQTVKAEDVICDLVQPVEGIEGITVSGAKIRAKSVKTPIVPAGANTKVNTEKTALIATCDGQLNFSNGFFHVDKMLKIPGDVDISVGNLDVIGDLDIGGSVGDGFSVQATGNIVVHGLVEGAQLKAGGNVQIILGVKGNSKGRVKAQGNVICKYLENARVWAGKNVMADNIVNSHVYARNSVVVNSGGGAIIGGQIVAGVKITAKRIGNESHRATELVIGENPSETEAVAKLVQELEVKKREIKENELNIRYLENKGKTELVQKLKLKLSIDRICIERKAKQIEKAKQVTESTGRQVVADTLYPQTSIEIGGQKMLLSTVNQMCRIYKADGELKLGMK